MDPMLPYAGVGHSDVGSQVPRVLRQGPRHPWGNQSIYASHVGRLWTPGSHAEHSQADDTPK
eukprot:8934999-Pyramimonas_sp.AAC.1